MNPANGTPAIDDYRAIDVGSWAEGGDPLSLGMLKPLSIKHRLEVMERIL